MKKAALFAFIVAILFSFSSCKVVDNSATEDYEALQSEYDSLNAQYATLQNEYTAYKNDTADWVNYSDAEKAAAVEVAKREGDIQSMDAEITEKSDTIASLKTEIDNLNNQIASLKDDVVKLQGEPLSFPAGYFTAGKDFTVGRYKIYGGSSNFFVHDSSGGSRVNVILGSVDDGFYVKEYVYTFRAGDEIESRSSFKMVPVS